MYYQNGNYMQDLNYYNQTPNFGYNPYNQTGSFQNQSMNNGQQNIANITNMQMGQCQSLSAMYPAVYRIISPVAAQVISNNNTNFLTEEALNNMVDTVYNIVEGDINVTNDPVNANVSDSTENSSTNCSRTTTPSTNGTANRSNTANSIQNRSNSLLRDMIKIIILNDISSRRQCNMNSMMMQNNMMNSNMNQGMYM